MTPLRSRALVAVLAVWLPAGAPGCAGLPRGLPERIAPCPGPLPSTATLPPGAWRERRQARFVGGGVDLGLDLVAEKRGERLVIVAFHPLGAEAFSAVQQGDELQTESALGRALPVPPANVLRDLYATGLGNEEAATRSHVDRPECGYRASFVRVSREPLEPRPAP